MTAARGLALAAFPLLILVPVAGAAAQVPLPPDKPEAAGAATPGGETEQTSPPGLPDAVPLPKKDARGAQEEDGEDAADESAAPGGTVDEETVEMAPAEPEPDPVPTVPVRMSDEARAACLADLDRLGVTYEVMEPVAGMGGCGIGDPLKVSALAPGVSIRPQAQMGCLAAVAAAEWVDGLLLPATAALGNTVRLTEIVHGSTYVCRRRNNAATGKLSEHATGNAIDIMRFEFEGRAAIPVRPRAGRGTMEEAFQRTARAGACLYFTTVLGPGSDDYHDDHLHVDLAQRRSGDRLCQ